MPEMDGYSFIARVRSEWPTLPLQTIALSGFGRTVDEVKAREAGFDAHLSKPASMEDLTNVLALIAQRAVAETAITEIAASSPQSG